MRGNTKVMSEMLTEMVPGQEDPSDHELLQVCHLEFCLVNSALVILHIPEFYKAQMATRGSVCIKIHFLSVFKGVE